MPKNLLRDILPKNKKSIRDISFSPEQNFENDYNRVIYHKSEEPGAEYRKNGKIRNKKHLWIVASLAVVFLFFVVSYSFSGAEVLIEPKTENQRIDLSFQATKSGMGNDLSYNIVPVEKIGSEMVQADGERKVEKKASGVIIVYNSFSSNPQRLVKNTRFQTSKGFVYKIDRSISIPGKTIENGKSVPGNVEATVFADTTGSEYNIGLTDFTIPGFKSDPARYAAFYARSKTPIEGGFSGMTKFVSDAKLKAARLKIHSDMEQQIFSEIKASIPNYLFMPNNAYSAEFQSLPDEDVSSSAVSIKEKAFFKGFVFEKRTLSSAIAGKTLGENFATSSSVYVDNLNKLEFAFQDKNKPIDDKGNLKFSLKCSCDFVWTFNEEKLKTDLAGIAKSQINSIFSQYPEIVKAQVIIRPFWSNSLPEKIKNIIIVNKLNNKEKNM